MRDGGVVGLGSGNEFPAIVEPHLSILVHQAALGVLHDETGAEHDQGAVNVGRRRFLLYMKRVDDETMRFKFTMEPLNRGAVGSHRDLSKDMLAGSGEIGRVENNLVVLQAELERVPVGLACLFSHVVPFKVVHTVVHAVFGGTLPEGVAVFSPELVGQRLVSLVLEEAISSAHGSLNHNVSDSDHDVAGTDTAVLVRYTPLGHVDGLGPVYL